MLRVFFRKAYGGGHVDQGVMITTGMGTLGLRHDDYNRCGDTWTKAG